MKTRKKTNEINYFEEVYLGKKGIESSVKESRKLQKLLTAKALKSSIQYGGITPVDFKNMYKDKPKNSFTTDIDSFLLP
ncbi:MAG: hypothetical protein ACXVPW_18785, partial [Bacteroidia bacterium]